MFMYRRQKDRQSGVSDHHLKLEEASEFPVPSSYEH
jgi:hypothetical protein